MFCTFFPPLLYFVVWKPFIISLETVCLVWLSAAVLWELCMHKQVSLGDRLKSVAVILKFSLERRRNEDPSLKMVKTWWEFGLKAEVVCVSCRPAKTWAQLWVSLCAEPSNINPAISSFFSYLCLTSYFLSPLAILKISFILVDTWTKKKTDIFPDSSSIELKPRSMSSLLYMMKPIPVYIPIHAAATCWWACRSAVSPRGHLSDVFGERFIKVEREGWRVCQGCLTLGC